jgi:hypothetical protein
VLVVIVVVDVEVPPILPLEDPDDSDDPELDDPDDTDDPVLVDPDENPLEIEDELTVPKFVPVVKTPDVVPVFIVNDPEVVVV